MSAAIFDTLAYTKKLKAAGVPEEQAEAQAEAIAEAMTTSLATKEDVAIINGELKLMKWMLTLLIGVSITILFKVFGA